MTREEVRQRTKMSSQDYDECEKIFCGTWKLERDENLDAFFTAAGKYERLCLLDRSARTRIKITPSWQTVQ